MTPEQERRRHQRYPLRLPVTLRRGTQGVEAQVINGSAGGCLVLTSEPLKVGEQVTVSLPELGIPEARLVVVRIQQQGSEWLVGMCFEASRLDEAVLEELSRQFQVYANPASSTN